MKKILKEYSAQVCLQSILDRIIISESYMCVYIVCSSSGTLYVGVTNDIRRRMREHKEKITRGFTATYHCNKLVYLELCDTPSETIEREKQIKNWRREKKERLIRSLNPPWVDLSAFLPDQ